MLGLVEHALLAPGAVAEAWPFLPGFERRFLLGMEVRVDQCNFHSAGLAEAVGASAV